MPKWSIWPTINDSRNFHDSCLAWSSAPWAMSSIFRHINSTEWLWSLELFTCGVSSCKVLIRFCKSDDSLSRLAKISGPKTNSLGTGKPVVEAPLLTKVKSMWENLEKGKLCWKKNLLGNSSQPFFKFGHFWRVCQWLKRRSRSFTQIWSLHWFFVNSRKWRNFHQINLTNHSFILFFWFSTFC